MLVQLPAALASLLILFFIGFTSPPDARRVSGGWLYCSSCFSSISLLRRSSGCMCRTTTHFTTHLDDYHSTRPLASLLILICIRRASIRRGGPALLLILLFIGFAATRDQDDTTASLLILLCRHQDVTETLADLPLALMLRLRFFTFRSCTSASSAAIRAKSSEMVCCSCVGSFLVLAPVLTMML